MKKELIDNLNILKKYINTVLRTNIIDEWWEEERTIFVPAITGGKMFRESDNEDTGLTRDEIWHNIADILNKYDDLSKIKLFEFKESGRNSWLFIAEMKAHKRIYMNKAIKYHIADPGLYEKAAQ